MIKVSKPHQYQIDTINAAVQYLETVNHNAALNVLQVAGINIAFVEDPAGLAESLRNSAENGSTLQRLGAYKAAQRILLAAGRLD